MPKLKDILDLAKVSFLSNFLSWVSYILVITTVLILGLITTGCGHNRYNEYNSTGVAISIPFGDLGSLSICLGSSKSSVAMVRGGSSISTETAEGAGLLSAAGGASKITTIKFNEQLNEGNIVKIMDSPNVPDEAKILIAKACSKSTAAPEFSPSALQTREAVLYNHGFTNQLDNPFPTTGIDRAVDNVTEITTTVVDDVSTGIGHTAQAVTDTTRTVVNNVDSTVKKISDNMSIGNKIRDAVIDGTANLSKTAASVLLLAIVLCLFIVIVVMMNRKKPKQSKSPKVSAIPEPPSMMPEPPTDGDENIDIPPEEEIQDIDPESAPHMESEPVQHRNWFMKFLEGLFACIKACFGFWKGLEDDEREAIKQAGKKVASYRRKK